MAEHAFDLVVVDGDDADHVLALHPVGNLVADPALDGELHVQPALGVERRDALLGVDDDEPGQDGPERDVRTGEEDGSAEPEPLIGVEKPCREEHTQRRHDECPGVAPSAEPEVGRVIEQLQHEVFPVDVDAAPEVREARGKEVAAVRLGQVESEEVQHPDNEVELPGDPQVEEEVGHEELHERARPDDLGGPQRVDDLTCRKQVGNPPAVDLDDAVAAATAVICLVGFGLFFTKSRIGIAMRAVADDQQAALTMGISVRRVFAMAWALAAVSALIAGVLLADITAVEPRVAAFGLLVFPVVILGGLDSVPGTIVGGLTIGLVKQYTSGYLDPGFAEVVPYLLLVLILLVRPYGLFGEKRIERV